MKILTGKNEEIDLNKSDSVIRKQICDAMSKIGIALKTEDCSVILFNDGDGKFTVLNGTTSIREDVEEHKFTNEDEAYLKFRFLVEALCDVYMPHLI